MLCCILFLARSYLEAHVCNYLCILFIHIMHLQVYTFLEKIFLSPELPTEKKEKHPLFMTWSSVWPSLRRSRLADSLSCACNFFAGRLSAKCWPRSGKLWTYFKFCLWYAKVYFLYYLDFLCFCIIKHIPCLPDRYTSIVSYNTWSWNRSIPEHRLHHLEHGPVVGHVQHQLDLLLLLELGAGSVVLHVHHALLPLKTNNKNDLIVQFKRKVQN